MRMISGGVLMRYLKLLLLLPVVALLYYLRTWFHGVLLFLYATPAVWQMLIFTLLLHYAVIIRIPAFGRSRSMVVDSSVSSRPGEKGQVSYTLAPIVSATLYAVLLTIGLILASWFRGAHIANDIRYIPRDNLPESAVDIRLMPYGVAYRYAQDSLQLSQYRLGTENIASIDGRLSWVFPLTPDGLVIRFLRKNKGIVYVDATTEMKNTTHVWNDMQIGEGMQIRDNLYWNIHRQRFFVETDDPFYLTDGEEIYTVVGAISYSYHFRLGIMYSVPRFAGVFLLNTAGEVRFLEPAEAADEPILADNRVFPEKLARRYVDAHQYHLGIRNKLFIHEDQIKIQDVLGPRANRQPYLMSTEEGLKWFLSAEPFGASHGIFKIFLVDAVSGEIEMYELPTDRTLTGPVRAVDYVRRSNPVVDWSRFDSVEPLPFVRNGELMWKLVVIPDDAAGIAYQVFVDAATNDVIELRSEDDVRRFVAGLDVHLEPRDPSGTASRGDLINLIRERLLELESLISELERI